MNENEKREEMWSDPVALRNGIYYKELLKPTTAHHLPKNLMISLAQALEIIDEEMFEKYSVFGMGDGIFRLSEKEVICYHHFWNSEARKHLLVENECDRKIEMMRMGIILLSDGIPLGRRLYPGTRMFFQA